MQRALRVAGEHDRGVGIDARKEIAERLAHVGIGGIDGLLALGRGGEEGAHRRLTVARRPDLGCGTEGAGHAAQVDAGDALGLGIAALAERRIPGIAADEAGRVDEEHRKGPARLGGRYERCAATACRRRLPARRIGLADARTGIPQGGVLVGIGLQRLDRREGDRGHRRPSGELCREQRKQQRGRYRRDDAERDHIEELPRHCCGCLARPTSPRPRRAAGAAWSRRGPSAGW